MDGKIISIAIILLFLLPVNGEIFSMKFHENNIGNMNIPTRKGEYVTGMRGNQPDAEEMEWLSKFEIVHAGSIDEPLSSENIEYLRQKGVKIIMADDWMPAGYYYPDGNNTPFMKWVYENRYLTTLNPEGPFPHCWESGYDWREYYFDFAVDELVAERVKYLVNGMKSAGYNGIFFDWGNGLFLREKGYESINATYYSRHPSLPYSRAAANFLAALRGEMPEMVMENNQGFREAEYYLPVLDYDMAESYITDCDYYGKRIYVEGYGLTEVPETIYYPVSENEFSGNLNDTLYYLDYLAELRGEYGGENFKKTVYMNYAAPEFIFLRKENGHDVYTPSIPKNAIYFGYAVAKLAGQISYTEVPWNHSYERCDVYFYDLGEPLGQNYEKIDGGYVRYYSNGLVVVGDWQSEVRINLSPPNLPSCGAIYDAFEEKWIESKNGSISIVIKPRFDNLTGRMAPSGRVFIYPKNENLEIEITKPEEGKLYFMDREIIATGGTKAIILGKIEIEANTNGIKVEFYIDNELKYEDNEMPYSWAWDEFAFGDHEIKVVAYDEDGCSADDELKAVYFNLG